MKYSLRQRLLLLASVVLLFGFAAMAIVLESSFARGIQRELEEKMQLQMLTLLAAAEQKKQLLTMPNDLPDPRFNQPSSGLYGFIFDQQGHELWRSTSALGLIVDLDVPLEAGNTLFGEHISGQGQKFTFASIGTIWEQGGTDYRFGFVVLEDSSAIIAANAAFRSTLWLMLAIVALLLLVIQWLVLRWGLSPLQKIAQELKLIEEDKLTVLNSQYPKEIKLLADNINQLLQSELGQRQRYKDRMADLAHSLKTPLAIINNFNLESDSIHSKTISEQVSRMNQIVEYQLKRAVAGSAALGFRRVNVLKICQQLTSALSKVYRDKNTKLKLNVSPEVYFRGDESDLMEILGNLLDNAYKYGVSQVEVQAENKQGKLSIVIEDDGAGIDSSDLDKILQRGTRLDSQEIGQGIGLASVNELIKQYGGNLTLEPSHLCGAKFTVLI